MKVINPKSCLRISVIIMVVLCSVAFSRTIYVDDDAAGANNGTSWTNAYVYLQEALADAKSAEKPVEIHVAQGIYKPDGGIMAIPEFDWRTLTFQLISGVSLKGGYAGATSPDPNARDIELYKTTLSGDLAGDDINDDDLLDLIDRTYASFYPEPNREDNIYNIITGSGTDRSAILDGFTIDGGNAWYPSPTYGGGMYNMVGSPTIKNCTFHRNWAPDCGGGMFNSNSNPTLTNCTFVLNYSFYGGGIYNYNSSPTLTNCTFINNIAVIPPGMLERSVRTGGGLYNRNSSLILTNCTFSGNSANRGGGIYNYESNLTLTNCTFSGNTGSYGSGISGGDLVLTNCILSGNSSFSGGCISSVLPILTNCTLTGNRSENGDDIISGYPTLFFNCIVWGNTPPQIPYSAYTRIYYSDIQGGWEGRGEGNIYVDPSFANPGYWAYANDPNIVAIPEDPNLLWLVWLEGDYHLKSQTGRYDPVSESWVVDDVTSPCIDAGDPNSDWTGETWPHGERINMGAFGGTPEASMSTRSEQMSLPKIAYIYKSNTQAAESFRVFLAGCGCPTTLIKLNDIPSTPFDSYELLIVADDTEYASNWNDPETITAIENSGKPIVGLGEGGYDFFGMLGLSIGRPNGMHGSANSITVLDPNSPLFSTPYPIDIPEDRILQLYTETDSVSIYLWPEVPETVTALGMEANNPGYYPLVMEHNRYLLWGFTESPEKMTEVGKTLFINVVIRAANSAW